jgi:hypothetical protein
VDSDERLRRNIAAYAEIAGDYARRSEREPRPWFREPEERLAGALTPGAQVLDIGCALAVQA